MGKDTNFAHFLYAKINFFAKSQRKNYSTENKVIGNLQKTCNNLTFVLQYKYVCKFGIFDINKENSFEKKYI